MVNAVLRVFGHQNPSSAVADWQANWLLGRLRSTDTYTLHTPATAVPARQVAVGSDPYDVA